MKKQEMMTELQRELKRLRDEEFYAVTNFNMAVGDDIDVAVFEYNAAHKRLENYCKKARMKK